MDGEAPGPEPEEIQEPPEELENYDARVQGLRDRIADPKEFWEYKEEKGIVFVWGSVAEEVINDFHEKYSQWPGAEEEDRQIKEYLGFGKGSVWETKAREAYKTMFPGEPLEEEKWKKAAKLVKRELKDSRLEEYERHKGWSADDNKESVESTTAEPEKIESIRANGETRGKETEDNDPNEDSILVDDEKRIYGVFDGMGASVRPAEASAMAAKVIGENIQGDSEYSSPDEVQKAVYKTLEKADKDIHEKIGDGQTTATIAKIWEREGQQYLVWGHVGDSRLYLDRESEPLKQITVDDSMAAEALKNGIITEQEATRIDQAESKADLREDKRLIHFFNNRHIISGALGDGDYSIQSGVLEIKPGDKIVLTSDGIHDNLTNNDIAITVSNAHDAAKELVDRAIHHSREGRFRSKTDDMSAVVVEIPDDRDHFADFPDPNK